MIKVGKKYLALDPTKDSDKALDYRRIWMPRVPVEVVRKHWFPTLRYDVRTEDGIEFNTHRLEPLKKVEVRQ